MALSVSMVTWSAVPAQAQTPTVPDASSGTPSTVLPPVKPTFAKVPNAAGTSAKATATTWPAASAGTVTIAANGAKPAPTGASPGADNQNTTKPVYAGSTPVWIEPASATAGSGTPAGAAKAATGVDPAGSLTSVSVSVLAHGAATAAGIDGVIATLTPVGSGSTRVGLNYSSFAQVYGGNYGLGLRLVQLPACALTTPAVAACRVQTPLAQGQNDASSQLVSGVVTFPSAAIGSAQAQASSKPAATVIAAVPADGGSGSADGGGPAGQYGATTLKAEGSWAEGGDTGGFTYSYPIAVPPATSKLAPDIDLSYNSEGTDGQTASSQAQANWIGDGWSTADSYIEQSFVSCNDDPEGTVLPSAEATYDDCYGGPVLTLSLNGTSTSMVWDSTHSVWKAQDDVGDVISQVGGSIFGPGSDSSSYWKVTERDGSTYYFGMNELPGWTTGDATTNSVDTVPVYSANSGDPCYNSAGFTSSVCTEAYRWHLDYVTKLAGTPASSQNEAMSYYYDQSTNYYGEDKGKTVVPYTRDSHLDHIDYGFTDPNAYGTVPDKIAFVAGDRCEASSTVTCDPLNSSTSANWSDVPFTDICQSTGTCSNYGPSFFSTVALASITTEQWNGSSYGNIDSYALVQTMPSPGDGTSATLWLSTITRTAEDASAQGGSVTMPAVTFGGTQMANRVVVGTGLPALNRFRITSITTETGSVISVTYSQPDPCSATALPTPSSNTSSCFPEEWTPAGYTAAITDWFNAWAVKSVASSDPTGGSAGQYSGFTYNGGAAWHFDDSEMVQSKYRTWGQFRGYASVVTTTGQGGDPVTQSQTWYYRGMDGNWLNTTGTSVQSATVTDTNGGVHPDSDQLAGQVLESAKYNDDTTSATTNISNATITSFWVSGATATRLRPAQGTAYAALPPLTANTTASVETWTTQAITDSSPTTWRTSETDTSYDSTVGDVDFGLQTVVYKHGDLALENGSSSQATCTLTTYAAANTSENLVGLVAEAQTDDKKCAGANPDGASVPTGTQINQLGSPTGLNLATDVISDTRTFYDDPTFANLTTWPQSSAPSVGQSSVVESANGVSGSSLTYQIKSKSTYDSYGRPLDVFDGNNNETVFGYTTNSYGLTTGTTVTNPAGQISSTTVDPARNQTTSSTDINGVVTTIWYDELGRTIDVWQDSRATTAKANSIFTYTVSGTAPSSVTTQTLTDSGLSNPYTVSVTLYDALDRVRQIQTSTPQGGRLITDTFYDTHGWNVKSNTNYWDQTSTPTTTLVTVSDSTVPNQTRTSYDGQGRATVSAIYDDANLYSTSYTQYTGDETLVAPPSGGTAQATVVDALGRTSALEQFTSAPTVTTSTVGGFTIATISGETAATTRTTSYTYNSQGRAYQTITPASDTYSITYNFLGQVQSTTDPDTGGIANETYDNDGNVTSTTNSAGQTVSTVYDALGRKLDVYDAPIGAQQTTATLADSYSYDGAGIVGGTRVAGQLTGATSYNVVTTAGVTTSTPVESISQSSFNVFGKPQSTTYTVDGTGSLAGSYTYSYGYTATLGEPTYTTYPAAGGLPSETVAIGYEQSGPFFLPANTSGANNYTDTIKYTDLGQVATQQLGYGTALDAVVNNTYDPTTGRMTDSQIINPNVTSTPINDTSYSYDKSGQITSQTDVRQGSETETQCYNYDQLDRLTQAWTTGTAASSCSTAPSSTTVGDGIPGSAYWTSWAFGLANTTESQPISQDQHALTAGGTDTLTSYTYNGNSTGQTNTLTKAQVTGASSSTSTYQYNPLGQTTSRPNNAGQVESLSWSGQGQLATVGISGTSTSYLYGTDGNVLEQQSPTSTTLYLPDQDVVLTGTSTLSNTRYYPLPGGGEVVRTATGFTGYAYILQDLQGTGAIQLTASLTSPVWQQETPYGAPRGGTAVGWADPRGFLNKAQDTTDSLTLVGAREYDTAVGVFINADSDLETTDPEQIGGYQYAGDNPVCSSDPTGNRRSGTGAGGAGGNDGASTEDLASQLTDTSDGSSDISGSTLAYIDKVSRETGVHRDLLIALCWQEQQWYQAYDNTSGGMFTWLGRRFDFGLEQTIYPGKSLGITHLKLPTVRGVIANMNDSGLSNLNDAQLTKMIEQDPDLDILISANYVKQLSQNPYGANTDEDLFVLYATGDNAETRAANAKYGSDYTKRSNSTVSARMQDWNAFSAQITAANEWVALTPQQQADGLTAYANDNPSWLVNGNGSLNFPYPAPPGTITSLTQIPSNGPQVPDPTAGPTG